MSVISSQSGTVSHRQHWTVPVSREETLAVREKFQRIGWRPPNHKPKTKKDVAWAKNVWDRYLILVDLQVVSELRQMTFDFLSVPAMSSETKRVFSQAKHTIPDNSLPPRRRNHRGYRV